MSRPRSPRVESVPRFSPANLWAHTPDLNTSICQEGQTSGDPINNTDWEPDTW